MTPASKGVITGNEHRTMPRPRTQCEALTPGQLARRWRLGVDRVRHLIQDGKLPGAFKVPSAGRYGEAVRVPLAVVLQVEEEWAISPAANERRRKPQTGQGSLPPTRALPGTKARFT